MSITDPSAAQKRVSNDADLDAAVLAGWDAAMSGEQEPEAAIKQMERRVIRKDPPAPPPEDEDVVETQAEAASQIDEAAMEEARARDAEPHDADLDPETAKAEEAEAEARDQEPAEPKKESPKPPDPQTLKRLEQLQRAEQRNKAAAQQRMMEIQQREQALATQIAAVQRFDSLKERVRFDPVGVLQELGLGEEDFDAAAQQLYAMGSAGAKDPRVRAKAAEAMQARQTMTETQRLQKELDDLRNERERERQEAQMERYKANLGAQAQKLATDETPIVKAMFAEDADGAREFVYFVANDMYQQTGEEPDLKDVVNALEHWQRAELKKRGINPDLLHQKTTPPVADKTKPAKKTLTNNLTAPRAPKQSAPVDDDELDAQIVRALESGQLD